MSRQLTPFQSIVLGFLVIFALALGGTALFFVNDRIGWANDAFRVTAAFDDIGGVEPGARVRIQGMDAGSVEAILPPNVPGEQVKLQIRLSGKYRHLVREDSAVQLYSDGMFSGRSVFVIPGSPSAKPVEDFANLRGDVPADTFSGLAQTAKKLDSLLSEVDGAMQSLKKSGASIEDLGAATKKLNTVLVKADTAFERIERGEGTLGKLATDDTLYTELTDSLKQMKAAMHEVRSGEGTLGKLVKSNEAYAEAMASLQDVRRMVNSVKQNSDAIKSLPVVRSYVVDINKDLIRPECQRYVRVFKEADLFEPGKAVLTAKGKNALDDGGAWLNEQKYDKSELLIAAFADPSQNPEFAQTVTQKQGEVALEYLKSQHNVHRTGRWWWSTRTMRSLGCGTTPSPLPDSEKLPAARLELIVFVPQ